MSFQPVIPSGGLAGWSFLKSTMASQRNTFDAGARISSDTAYFEANIASIRSAEDLVADRRLLRVALGAFGLSGDIDSRFLIRRVLEDGVTRDDALANRLTDARYKDLAGAFGFDAPDGPRSRDPEFGARLAEQFRRRSFEVAVGKSDDGLRLALNADRELTRLGSDSGPGDTGWFRIMGTPPLRKVFETALSLPDGIAKLDLDKQLELFKDRAASRLGLTDLSDLSDQATRSKLVETFLLQDQIKSFSRQSPAATALTLLQAIPPRG